MTKKTNETDGRTIIRINEKEAKYFRALAKIEDKTINDFVGNILQDYLHNNIDYVIDAVVANKLEQKPEKKSTPRKQAEITN